MIAIVSRVKPTGIPQDMSPNHRSGAKTLRHSMPVLGLCLLALGLALRPAASASASPYRVSDDAPQAADGPTAAFTVSAPGQSGTSPSAHVHDQVVFDASSSRGMGLRSEERRV